MTASTHHIEHEAERKLNILHVFRAPAGGLFRHVQDLVRGQVAAGHRVGVVCASNDVSPAAEKALLALEPDLALGMRRIFMSRLADPRDLAAITTVRALRSSQQLDIVHGHGAKGGLMARLAVHRPPNDAAPDRRARSVYTPHGGSLHYDATSLSGMAYLAVEKLLNRRTDAFIFESEFARSVFARKIGAPKGNSQIVHNGVGETDFLPLPNRQSTYDIAFVGELRMLKGIDILLDALATMRGRNLRIVIAGDGPDRDHFIDRACSLGLAPMVTFPGALPAREVFASAKMLVVPSLAESLPYIVLEALAAAMPLVATNCGGIPEIFADRADSLVPPGDALALAEALTRTLDAPAQAEAVAKQMRQDIAHRFSIGTMVRGVDDVYRTALTGLPVRDGVPQVMSPATPHSANGA